MTRTFFQLLQFRIGVTLAIALLFFAGCQDSVQEVKEQVSRATELAQLVLTGESGLDIGWSVAATRLSLVQAEEEKSEDEVPDYWKKVEFNRENFESVLGFVRDHYIDPEVDESRAYAEACGFMMMGLHTPHLVVPGEFYRVRKGHADEEGVLSGPTVPFKPGLDVTVVKFVEKEEEKNRKRLSDAEIGEAREKAKVRELLMEVEWKKIKFGRDEFERCFVRAEDIGRADPDQDKKDLEKNLWIWGTQGFLRSLDPHSSIVSAKAWEESTKKTTDSSFNGIGAILTQRDDMTIVESPIQGQPAYKAGLRAGDVIIRVDDKSIKGMPLGKVVKKIRGPKNTVVVLTLRREGEPEDLKIPITRAFIEIQNVQGRMLEEHPDMGYVKLTGFVPTSVEMLRNKIEDLTSKTTQGRLRGLILDLRNNSGGLLQQAVEVGDLFVASGDIVSVRDRLRGGRSDKVYTADESGTLRMPLIVLVNDASASASEIVAGAVQDNGRGLIAGERTFGKASVQTLFNSNQGGRDYYIKLTVARYYAPSGRTIQVLGIQPDLEIVPELGKPMPLGFREENLGKHLTAIGLGYKSPNAEFVETLAPCVGKRGKAEKVHQADPNPQLRFDYQLMKAADYLECMADLRAQERVSTDGPYPPSGATVH